MTFAIRVGRALAMGLAWAAFWVPAGAVGARVMIGELDPEHIGGPLYASVICGAIFSGLAGWASGRRRLLDLTVVEATAWGAVSGLAVGMMPFVLGEGDTTDGKAAWATLIVATCATAAWIAARRLRPGALTPFQAATLAAMVAGTLAGSVLWVLTADTSTERWLPITVGGGLAILGALSGAGAVLVSRWDMAARPTSAGVA